MTALTADELTAVLDDAGYDYRSYSGRSMYGKKCVGVDLESLAMLWDMATELAREGLDVPAPQTDSMGMGIIAYWPRIAWPA